MTQSENIKQNDKGKVLVENKLLAKRTNLILFSFIKKKDVSG